MNDGHKFNFFLLNLFKLTKEKKIHKPFVYRIFLSFFLSYQLDNFISINFLNYKFHFHDYLCRALNREGFLSLTYYFKNTLFTTFEEKTVRTE